MLELYGEGASYKLSGSDISDFSVLIAKSCTITLENYKVSDSQSPFIVSDGATLTLLIGEGTSTIAGATTTTHGNHPGVEVQRGGTVVIDKVEGKTDAECILSVTGGNDCAAIGAKDNSSSGNITINGGTVTATETDGRGCGIGAGEVTGGTATVNEIIITGGTVTASASTDKDNSTAYQLEAAGAGIGAGASTACGNVTIAGGHITANGGTSAAGIGAGTGADADCGTITFSGGTVEAERGGSTAQNVGNGANGECSNVVVTGGSLVTDHGAVTPAPSGIGNEAGHAVTIQNDNWTVGQAIEISGVPAGYGTNDIIVSENKSIVVWVPDGDYPLEVNDDWYVVSVGGANGTAAPATLVDVPSVVGAEDLVYTGSPITGVPAGEGYTITGYVATDPGHYTATLTPAAGCLWSDHTMTPVQVEWYIAPAVIDPQYGTVTYDDVNDA